MSYTRKKNRGLRDTRIERTIFSSWRTSSLELHFDRTSVIVNGSINNVDAQLGAVETEAAGNRISGSREDNQRLSVSFSGPFLSPSTRKRNAGGETKVFRTKNFSRVQGTGQATSCCSFVPERGVAERMRDKAFRLANRLMAKQ